MHSFYEPLTILTSHIVNPWSVPTCIYFPCNRYVHSPLQCLH